MTQEEIFFKEWMEKQGYEYDNIPLTEMLKAYKDHCVKKELKAKIEAESREILIAYEKNHYTSQEWILVSKQCIEDIDNFLLEQ